MQSRHVTRNYISFSDIESNNFSLSSSQYKGLQIKNKNLLLVENFLNDNLTKKYLGTEVGSINYIERSSHYFLRTGALQEHSFLPEISSETAIPILPHCFKQMALNKGDLIISKDGNIGEIIILDKDYPNYMLSGALYKLPVNKNKYYLLAFIKHAIFKEQLDLIIPKGATIRHAKNLFLKCKIPLPNYNKEETIQFIELLTKAIINKEILIKQRHTTILQRIEKELSENQLNNKFSYKYPALSDFQDNGRMDAKFHSEYYKKLIFPILNYNRGHSPLTNQGLELKPGPSLEIKLLKTRIDSDTYIKGFYRLITPTQISNTGILEKEQFIGTPKKIATIKHGDILFGESGTGRTMVYLDDCDQTINNAHAHILRPINGYCSLKKAITIRCILQYYKERGITDCLTVGGNGGHLSPSYFNRVFIPNFPDSKQSEIAKLYHNHANYPTSQFNLNNFLKLDHSYNEHAGIYELDKTAKQLRKILNLAIDSIINNKPVNLQFTAS